MSLNELAAAACELRDASLLDHVPRPQWRTALENARDAFKAESLRHRGLKSVLEVHGDLSQGTATRHRPEWRGMFQSQLSVMTVMHPGGDPEHAHLQLALIDDGLAPDMRAVIAVRYEETARQAFEGLLQSPDVVWSQLAPRMPACENLGIARVPWLHGQRQLVRRTIQKHIADSMGSEAAKAAGIEVPEHNFYCLKHPCISGRSRATPWTLALHNFGWRCSTAPERPIEVKRCVYTSVMTWYFTDRDDPSEWTRKLFADKTTFLKTPFDDSDGPAVAVPLRSFESWVTEDINLASAAMIDHLLSVADAETARCELRFRGLMKQTAERAAIAARRGDPLALLGWARVARDAGKCAEQMADLLGRPALPRENEDVGGRVWDYIVRELRAITGATQVDFDTLGLYLSIDANAHNPEMKKAHAAMIQSIRGNEARIMAALLSGLSGDAEMAVVAGQVLTPANGRGTSSECEPVDEVAAVESGVSRQVERVAAQYRRAVQEKPDLAEAPDKAVYLWMKENLDEEVDEQLLDFNTWSRYLRRWRAATKTQKYSKRTHGPSRSVVRKSDV